MFGLALKLATHIACAGTVLDATWPVRGSAHALGKCTLRLSFQKIEQGIWMLSLNVWQKLEPARLVCQGRP